MQYKFNFIVYFSSQCIGMHMYILFYSVERDSLEKFNKTIYINNDSY